MKTNEIEKIQKLAKKAYDYLGLQSYDFERHEWLPSRFRGYSG